MPLRSLQCLCLLSFFLADVRDGLGPFLGLFLLERHWQPASIGLVMTVGGLAGLLATFPAGLLVDATRLKRQLIAAAALIIALCTLALWFVPSTPVAVMSQLLTGVAAAAVAPALAGITLGIVGQRGFIRQTGRNEAWNHAGNMSAALLAGFASLRWGLDAVFLLMMLMALASLLTVMAIRERDIDHRQARGVITDAHPLPVFSTLLSVPGLLLTGMTLLLFHLANAALLPMLSMRVAANPDGVTLSPGLYAALTVVIAQAVMIPVALLTARYVARWGWQRIILLALLVLPLRAAIAAGWHHPWAILPVQALDGIAAGILGVAVPGLLARMLAGSGRVNAGLAAVMVMQGVGAALSPALAGALASRYGYASAFYVLAAIAGAGVLLWLLTARRRAALTA
ncbi:MFS transporter [Pantoea sp. 1.19]|uniref:MFS transporter n=1 Tax=Pantoea sp. 1.19 TaxID=1925589 RepID=UPI0009490147|nr:MFS transporter [Pantoea sp. 1.19]